MSEPRRSPATSTELPDGTASERLVDDSVLGGMPADSSTIQEAAVTAMTASGRARKRGKLGIAAWMAIFWMGLLVFCAVFASFLPLADPINSVDANAIGKGSSADHIMGVDSNGRDVLSRVVYGIRASLEIGVGSVAIGFVVGGFLGLVGGYFKGRIGNLIAGLLDTLLAFPALILALAIVAFLGQTILNITIALAIVATPILARIARASALSWSEREFVLAARAQGAKHFRIIWREIFPNVLPAMLSIAVLGVAVAIVAEGGLSVLGVGVKLPTPSWGNIIQGGLPDLRTAPNIVLFPSAVIFLTVLSLNFLGDVVRARFDVRESGL
jgi:peptide/nickel transport system permease protein